MNMFWLGVFCIYAAMTYGFFGTWSWMVLAGDAFGVLLICAYVIRHWNDDPIRYPDDDIHS